MFLLGDLNEEVYISLPQEINLSHSNQVCNLLKFLYVLKQSTSNNVLQTISPFIHQSSFNVLLIYVDDLVIAGNNLEMILLLQETI